MSEGQTGLLILCLMCFIPFILGGIFGRVVYKNWAIIAGWAQGRIEAFNRLIERLDKE